MKDSKKNKIKASLTATKEKRKGQVCKVFEVKVVENHLSKSTKENLNRIFLEAKWLYNFALSQEDIFSVSDKIDKVQVKVKDVFEERELKILGSQMKQAVLDQLKQNVYALAKKKKQGRKVGRLKFTSVLGSINLKQFGTTYRINKNYICVQGIKQKLRVRGLEQTNGYEIANAKLIKSASGYYFKITCYKEKLADKVKSRKPQLGIDLGVKTQLTLSNGIEIKYRIEASAKMRRECQQASGKLLGSKNRYKANQKIAKSYEHLNNKKKDVSNKVVSVLKDETSLISFQNDNISGWQCIWGRRMFNTALGGITTGFRKTPTTTVEVDRFFASTKQCPCCSNKQSVSLDERIFACKVCGYTKHRDWKSADMILDAGIIKIGAERIELTPAESESSTQSILNRLRAIPNVRASLLVDAGSPLL